MSISEYQVWNLTFFFNCHLAVPWPTLGHSQGDSLTNLMLITAFEQVRPEGHREPHNEVGSLSPAERPAGFEQGTFQFWFQHLNPLGSLTWALNFSFLYLIHAITSAHASTCATSLMHVKSSMRHFCLWHLLSGTLEWRKWKKNEKHWIE